MADAGDETQDGVFLLSYAQAIRDFEPEKTRKLMGTPYAREQDARFLGITTIGIGETDWWLRRPVRIRMKCVMWMCAETSAPSPFRTSWESARRYCLT